MINSPIQVLLLLFALFATARVLLKLKRRVIPRVWGILWLAVWLAMMVVAILPQTTDLLAASVGIGRGADLVVYVALIALLYAVFRLVEKVQTMEREMTRLVRSLAVRDIDTQE